MRVLAWLLAATGALALAARPACAQEVSAQDRRSAAEAFDRGTAAYIADDFERAAHWFETAHRLAPAAAALTQAIRSHQRAGNALRAATLALRMQADYPDDETGTRIARRALRRSDRFFRVDVECDGCTVQLDGGLVEHPSFFVEPETDHEVVASFETGDRSETVRGEAGETRTLTFEAPPPPEPEIVAETETETETTGEGSETAVEPGGGGGGVPVWVTIGAAVITAGLGGTLIWSGVDTLDGVPAYEANPTQAALEDGQAREERTNWLIAGTAVAGAATLVLAILTDWGGGDDGGDDEAVHALLHIQGDGFGVGLTGRF